MNIQAQNLPPDQPAIIVIPFLQEEGLSTHLLRLSKKAELDADWLLRDFTAQKDQTFTYYAGRHKIVLLGLGDKPNAHQIFLAFRSLSQKLKGTDLLIGLDLRYETVPSDFLPHLVPSAVRGLYLGGYHPGKFKSNPEQPHPLWTNGTLFLLTSSDLSDRLLVYANRGYAVGATHARILDLVNAPANRKTPMMLAEWVRSSGKEHDFRVEVFDKKQLESSGFQAILSVSQGSAEPPCMLVMTYQGAPGLPIIGLVGKGVTFDTGGISIKPSTNMHHMKSDMGGAASVIGTIEAAARLQLPVHLVGIVPLTENAIGKRAMKPGDVIHSYSGRTIEVIDTDAEGRLILADALCYLIRTYNPKKVIDLATLTGSAVRALGYQAAALFCNHETMALDLLNAGQHTGERIWRMPLWTTYAEELQSDIADIRNLGTKPVAGAITAAKFLETFTDDHPQWAHLDIAGVAFNDTQYTRHKAASGFGLALLLHYLEHAAY